MRTVSGPEKWALPMLGLLFCLFGCAGLTTPGSQEACTGTQILQASVNYIVFMVQENLSSVAYRSGPGSIFSEEAFSMEMLRAA